MNLSDMFQEEEDRAIAEYRKRVESGQDAREREAFRLRSEEELARMERNGCISHEEEE